MVKSNKKTLLGLKLRNITGYCPATDNSSQFETPFSFYTFVTNGSYTLRCVLLEVLHENLNSKGYPMIGIIVELFISWLLLWLIDKKGLSVLGFKPTKNRITNLGVGLLIAAFSCITYYLMLSAFANNSWVLNNQLNQETILTGAWWTLKSVLFEELIFRGALLYIAIEKFGVKAACILSAVCFGVYHWFSYNLFGSPVQMVIIFIMTGIFGLTLAFAFAKTKSIYLPFGLHLGWNLFSIVVFSNGPLGQQIFIRANENQLEGAPSVFVFLFQMFALPLFTLWYLNILLKRKNLLLKANKNA